MLLALVLMLSYTAGDLKAAVAYADLARIKVKPHHMEIVSAVQSSLGYLYPLSKRTSVYTVFSYWHKVRKFTKSVCHQPVTDNFLLPWDLATSSNLGKSDRKDGVFQAETFSFEQASL